jgi:hypothetical protein
MRLIFDSSASAFIDALTGPADAVSGRSAGHTFCFIELAGLPRSAVRSRSDYEAHYCDAERCHGCEIADGDPPTPQDRLGPYRCAPSQHANRACTDGDDGNRDQ